MARGKRGATAFDDAVGGTRKARLLRLGQCMCVGLLINACQPAALLGNSVMACVSCMSRTAWLEPVLMDGKRAYRPQNCSSTFSRNQLGQTGNFPGHTDIPGARHAVVTAGRTILGKWVAVIETWEVRLPMAPLLQTPHYTSIEISLCCRSHVIPMLESSCLYVGKNFCTPFGKIMVVDAGGFIFYFSDPSVGNPVGNTSVPNEKSVRAMCKPPPLVVLESTKFALWHVQIISLI